jgi:hypothetical protein
VVIARGLLQGMFPLSALVTFTTEVPVVFVAAGGSHVLDGRPIYVSRGIGYEGGQVSLLILGGS